MRKLFFSPIGRVDRRLLNGKPIAGGHSRKRWHSWSCLLRVQDTTLGTIMDRPTITVQDTTLPDIIGGHPVTSIMRILGGATGTGGIITGATIKKRHRVSG